MSVEKICQYCGKRFWVPEARKETAKYCSVSCYAKARTEKPRKNPVVVKCKYCGKEFVLDGPRKSQRRLYGWGKFCSRECYNAYRCADVELTCATCGKVFLSKRYIVKRKVALGIKRFFCSMECRNIANRKPGYEGRSRPYRNGGLLRKVRESVEACENCGRKSADLQVHHILPVWLFDNPRESDKRENLVVLCKACHRRAHRKTLSTLLQIVREVCKQSPELRARVREAYNADLEVSRRSEI